MTDADLAVSFAIFAAKQRSDQEVEPNHILLGCLRVISRFGIASVGPWNLDLESLGVDWISQPEGPKPKVGFSKETVQLFDRAARISKSGNNSGIAVDHLLAAFASEQDGLMGELKRAHGITSATWRAAIAVLQFNHPESLKPDAPASEKKNTREYLTPEEAAEALNVHVQTMRAYIRTGRLPAFRVAGERAIRILRADLDKVLEPLNGEKKEE